MARIEPTIISSTPAIEGEVGDPSRQDGNGENIALILQQAITSGDIEVLRTTSDTGSYSGSSDASILIGDGSSFPSVDPGTPREKVDVEGAVRAFDFILDSNGREVGTTLDKLLPNAERLTTFDAADGSVQELSLNENANTISGSVSRSSGETISNESETSNEYEIGVWSGSGSQEQIQGTLNFDKGAVSGSYPADVFTQADTGELRLYVNGNIISGATVDLESTTGQINTTGGPGLTLGPDTGFAVSASSDVTFADDSATGNRYRSGQWQLDIADFGSFGLKTIEIVHFDTNTSTEISSTGVAVFYYDSATQNIIVYKNNATSNTGDGLSYGTVVLSGTKTVSGIDYVESATVETDVFVRDLYFYTFDENAISYTSQNSIDITPSSVPSPSTYNEVLNVQDTGVLGAGSSFEVVVGSASSPGESPTFVFNVNDNIQTNPAPVTIGGDERFLVDGQTSQPNPETENDFIVEDRRISETVTDFANVSVPNNFDNTSSIASLNELQTFGSNLVYPNGDFRSSNITPGGIEHARDNASGNYSSLSGTKYYVGYFEDTSGGAFSNFALEIQGTGQMISSTDSFGSNNQFKLEVRVGDDSNADPNSGLTGTGWLDVFTQFTSGNTADGDGAYNPDAGVNDNKTLDGTPIGITTQSFPTDKFQDRIFYRFTMTTNATSEIDSINIIFGGV